MHSVSIITNKFDYKSRLGVLNTTEEFEDTKGVIRICKSNKDRQHNDQKKKDK